MWLCLSLLHWCPQVCRPAPGSPGLPSRPGVAAAVCWGFSPFQGSLLRTDPAGRGNCSWLLAQLYSGGGTAVVARGGIAALAAWCPQPAPRLSLLFSSVLPEDVIMAQLFLVFFLTRIPLIEILPLLKECRVLRTHPRAGSERCVTVPVPWHRAANARGGEPVAWVCFCCSLCFVNYLLVLMRSSAGWCDPPATHN